MSFLGYGNMVPNSNINPAYVNSTSSTYSGSFSSNEIPGLPGLAGTKSGIDAVAGKAPGICMSGGLKRKIKNISNIYKMKRRSHTRRLKKKLRTMAFGRGRQRRHSSHRRHARHHTARRRHQHGGYSQYQNNMPSSQGYSLGGNLSASNSALANPPMYKAYDNVVDNYNHFTGKGFDSFGH